MIAKVEIDFKTPWLLGFLLTLRSDRFFKLKSRKAKQAFLSRCYHSCRGELSIREIKWCVNNKIEIKGLDEELEYLKHDRN